VRTYGRHEPRGFATRRVHRTCIVAIRDELAAGRTASALSLCNEALREIDNQADVVAPSRERPS